jgi:hypothetical protein
MRDITALGMGTDSNDEYPNLEAYAMAIDG